MRLLRTGTVSEVSSGCATIRVSVPCTSCRTGACGASIREPRIDVHGSDAAALAAGEEVEVSVSADSLTRMSGYLFGPAIVWAVGFAAMPGLENAPLIGEVGIGVVGLVVTVAIGRTLAARRLALLDLKLQSTVG